MAYAIIDSEGSPNGLRNCNDGGNKILFAEHEIANFSTTTALFYTASVWNRVHD